MEHGRCLPVRVNYLRVIRTNVLRAQHKRKVARLQTDLLVQKPEPVPILVHGVIGVAVRQHVSLRGNGNPQLLPQSPFRLVTVPAVLVTAQV